MGVSATQRHFQHCMYRAIKKSLCTWRTIPTQLILRWPSQNTFEMWTMLYWTRSSRTQFGMSINVWRLAGDTLNITCNFLYCNHQAHRDFLIIQYKFVHLVTYTVSGNLWRKRGTLHQDIKLRVHGMRVTMEPLLLEENVHIVCTDLTFRNRSSYI
jgi:hypothetical protein